MIDPYETLMRERRERMEAEELSVIPKKTKPVVQMSASVSKPVVPKMAYPGVSVPKMAPKLRDKNGTESSRLPVWSVWQEESKSRYMDLVKRRLDQLESREEVAEEAGVSLNQLGRWLRETMLDPVE